ncbi:hypothetical protein [Pirellula sp. SH-Sr6A]|nr:hypothetical protein [Pirellula sp. SH-Sr6A]
MRPIETSIEFELKPIRLDDFAKWVMATDDRDPDIGLFLRIPVWNRVY